MLPEGGELTVPQGNILSDGQSANLYFFCVERFAERHR